MRKGEGEGGLGWGGRIPDGLVRAQLDDNGAAGREFVDGLPGRVALFLERWELRTTGPGMYGVTALVLPVERADGTAAALKLPAPDEENAGRRSRCARGPGRAAYGCWSPTRPPGPCCWNASTRLGRCRRWRYGTPGARWRSSGNCWPG